MNPDQIKELIGILDAGVPKENAKVSIQKYGDDLDVAFIIATENGYLRMGVEFLKAGITPHLPPERTQGMRPYAIDVDLDYLIVEDSDVRFDYFERSEDIQVKTYEESWVDKAVLLAIPVAILAVLALAIYGLATIIRGLA